MIDQHPFSRTANCPAVVLEDRFQLNVKWDSAARSRRKVRDARRLERHTLWTYRQSKARKFTSLKLEPLEFMSRFLAYILPPGYARVRALLKQAPLLTPQEQQTWNPSSPAPQGLGPTPAPEPVHPPPPCPCCRKPMRLICVWSAGHRPAIAPRNRPP